MKRLVTLAVASFLVAAPLVVLADDMTKSDGMKMPASAAMHNVMTLGALPASLQGKPVVVRVHADWCPACKATQTTYESVQKAFDGKASFVTFDVTNAKTAAASEEKAKSLGLSKLFDAEKTKTSTVAVINPKTGAVETTLYNDNTAADYTKAIDHVVTEIGQK